MALSYGTDGLKQKSWRVYIAPADTVGLDDGFDDVFLNLGADCLETLIAII